MIKSLYRLSLPMVTGFAQSLIKLCTLNWTAPDYTTLCLVDHLPKLRLKLGSIRGALPFQSLCNKAMVC